MDAEPYLQLSAPVQAALSAGEAVVALESTIISHGLPWPDNVELARNLEDIVRRQGAVPATIAVLGGHIVVGVDDQQIEHLGRSRTIAKLSRRDLGTVVALGGDGATTVAATMICAALVGIRVFATGGIGGVHRDYDTSMDVSADLTELARTRVAVVCSGAKSILDLPRTLQYLETLGVPVIGMATDRFPAFHTRSSGLSVDRRVDDVRQLAAILCCRERIGLQGGELSVNPIPREDEIPIAELDAWIDKALKSAHTAGVHGKDVTPYLLSRLAEYSDGRSVAANLSLVRNNAKVAACLARAYVDCKAQPLDTGMQ